MAERIDESSAEEINLVDDTIKVEELEDLTKEDSKDLNTSEEQNMPTPQREEEIIKKKYGGLVPKKPHLISNEGERAFFDSADWALGKVGAQKSKGPLQALLRPKLQPTTPHHQSRSPSVYAPSGDDEDFGDSDDKTHVESQSSTLNASIECANRSAEDPNNEN